MLQHFESIKLQLRDIVPEFKMLFKLLGWHNYHVQKIDLPKQMEFCNWYKRIHEKQENFSKYICIFVVSLTHHCAKNLQNIDWNFKTNKLNMIYSSINK